MAASGALAASLAAHALTFVYSTTKGRQPAQNAATTCARTLFFSARCCPQELSSALWRALKIASYVSLLELLQSSIRLPLCRKSRVRRAHTLLKLIQKKRRSQNFVTKRYRAKRKKLFRSFVCR